MSELLPLALGVVQETDTMEDLEAEPPFGMRVEQECTSLLLPLC